MKTLLGKIALLGVLTASFSLSANAASLKVYISAPDAQETYNGSATTETFDSVSLGTHTDPLVTPIGTYTFDNPATVSAGGLYGGANLTPFILIGNGASSAGPYTLTLNTPANYFGFWFSAGDVNNNLTFYKDGVELANFSTATILTLLSTPTVEALNGSTYQSVDYFGNPNFTPPGDNPTEPYAYVNIFAQGITFDTIVFDNLGATGTGFESDNHSIYSGATTPDVRTVFVTSVAAVPEPSALALLSVFAIGFVLWRSRKRLA